MRVFRSMSLCLPVCAALLTGLLSGLTARAGGDRGIEVVRRGGNNKPAWYVRVKVDHANAVYEVGQEMKVSVISERAGFLYLFYYNANKEWSCLYPNMVQKNNRIPAKTEIHVPDAKDKFGLRVTLPTGKELLWAVVTLEPLSSLELKALIEKNVTPLTDRDLKGVQVEIKRKESYAEHYVRTEVVDKNAPQPKTQRLGLFIGINTYRDPAIRQLHCCRSDAEVMAKTMNEFGGLTAEPIVLTDERATLKNIEKAIRQDLTERTRPGDMVIIYWSGHGGRCAATQREGVDPEPDGFDEYLVPYDAKLDSIDTIRSTMLLDDTFGRWIQDLDGRKVLVVLDACHSGGQAATSVKSLKDGFGKGIGNARGHSKGGIYKKAFFLSTELERLKKLHRLSKDIKQNEVAVLASSRAAQLSFERREGDLSVMTYYLAEQLKGSRGTVTVQQAYDNLMEKVPAYVKKEFSSIQTPLIAGEITPPNYVKPKAK